MTDSGACSSGRAELSDRFWDNVVAGLVDLYRGELEREARRS